MAKYYLGIDETGNFNILQPEGSFVCGVLTKISQSELDALYLKTYKIIKRQNVTEIAAVLPKVHWTEFQKNHDVNQQKSWTKALIPKIDKLFRSEGKPTIAPNEQAYWVGSVAVVIVEAISGLSSQDELYIFIDGRAKTCWDMTAPADWATYHREIKKQLDEYVKKHTPSYRCRYIIAFQNDNVNSFVNFADICAGILKSPEYRTKVADKVIICSENKQIAQLMQIISDLQSKGEAEKSQLKLEMQRAEQLEQKAEEEQQQREEIQKEKEKIQKEKDDLQNDLTKTEATKATLENELHNREEAQKNREEEQNKREEELQKQIKELRDRIAKAEAAPQQPAIEAASIPHSNSPIARRKEEVKSIDVEEESMDDDQLDLIERTLDKSMLVSGCAGSGKSVIAMHKAQQILEMGRDVIVISYTKSLCEFMDYGKTASNWKVRCYYHYEWKQLSNMPNADYIIVDEIQDFTREEIQEFINATKKCYFFFGDTAQSIYGGLKTTLSIKEISEITGLKPLMLYNNYRLPKPVAKITQKYIGINVNPYADSTYQSKEKNLPHIVQIDTMEAQAKAIIEIVKKQHDKTIGVLVSDNKLVQEFMDIFYHENFLCEAKYKDGDSSNYTLDFTTQNPKLMTYHSAKGLQFGTVIIPMFNGATSDNMKKSLYVAMTRTYRDLFILYSGELKSPLKEIDKNLYLSEL
jgi:hypothetical protein